MKVITHARLESWKQSRPALLEVTGIPATPTHGYVTVTCRFGNPVPRGPEIVERYLLDPHVPA